MDLHKRWLVFLRPLIFLRLVFSSTFHLKLLMASLFIVRYYVLFCKSMDWFLCNRDLRPERVNRTNLCHRKNMRESRCKSAKALIFVIIERSIITDAKIWIKQYFLDVPLIHFCPIFIHFKPKIFWPFSGV